jgi:phage shock protein PspC (stress-responsive transcriptional regulator)
MKKTLTVNLNGRVFHIDEDAYYLLDKYLNNLRIHFRREEGRDEILADFEARIEELLSERVRLGYNVITIADVESVIAQVGRPSDFDENEDDSAEEKSAAREEPLTGGKKKFYRNPDDKMIGGLCSGIAAFLGWNVVAVRIVAAILVPATTLWIVPVYLLLWLIVPEAVTAEQKLQMQGKPITVENIGKVVADSVENVKQTALKGGLLVWFVDFIAAFFKVCLVGLGLVIGVPVAIALAVVIVMLFCLLFGVGTGILGNLIPWSSSTFLFVDHPALATAACCLILGIPLVALVYAFISKLFHLKPVHAGVKWASIVLWIAAIVALPFSGFKTDWTLARHHNFGWNYHSDDGVFLLGDGVTAARREILPPIQQIRMEKNLSATLHIEQTVGDTATLLIEGDSNLIDKVNVRFNDEGTLSLSARPHFRYKPSTSLILRLQTPEPKGVKVYSLGNVHIPGVLRSSDFSIHMEGAGKIEADSLYVDFLKVENEGIGAVYLGGVVRRAALKLEGVGHIEASELVSDSVRAEVEGIGSIECNPVRYLHGYVNGVGSILYKKEPREKDTKVHGVGRIGRGG